MQVPFKNSITPGVSHQLLVDVTSAENPTNINYHAGADIALHISIRPKSGIVIVNKKLRSKWQKEFILRITSSDIAAVGDFTLNFLDNEVYILNKNCEPAELRFPTNYAGVREVRCVAGGQLIVAPAPKAEDPRAKGTGSSTAPARNAALDKATGATRALSNELQAVSAAPQTADLSRISVALRAHDPGAIDADTPELICRLSRIASQPEAQDLHASSNALMEAIFDVCESKARASMKLPVPVLVHEASPDNFPQTADPSHPSGPVVSLTCISSRIDRLLHTVETIKNQTLRPQSINLYVSEEPYLIDKGVTLDSEALTAIHALGVNIYSTPNYGPYRKQHCVVAQLQNAKADPSTILVTLDDDVLYPQDTLQKLASACVVEQCVVAQRGREMLTFEGRIAPYKMFRETESRKSHMNLANGRNGIAYQLRFFPTDHAFYVGPYLAPTADDIWCKWVTGYYCIPTTILEPKAAFNPALDFPDTNKDDKLSLFHSYNARGNNDITIKGLEVFFRSRLKSFYALHGDSK